MARWLVEVAAVALFYYLTARLGLGLAFANKNVTAIWPPTGIAVAVLVLRGNRVWPGIAIGAFTANLANGASVDIALGFSVGNTLAPLLAPATTDFSTLVKVSILLTIRAELHLVSCSFTRSRSSDSLTVVRFTVCQHTRSAPLPTPAAARGRT